MATAPFGRARYDVTSCWSLYSPLALLTCRSQRDTLTFEVREVELVRESCWGSSKMRLAYDEIGSIREGVACGCGANVTIGNLGAFSLGCGRRALLSEIVTDVDRRSKARACTFRRCLPGPIELHSPLKTDGCRGMALSRRPRPWPARRCPLPLQRPSGT